MGPGLGSESNIRELCLLCWICESLRIGVTLGAEQQRVGGAWLLEGAQRKALGSGVAARVRDPGGGGCGVGPTPPGDGVQPQREGPRFMFLDFGGEKKG